MYCSASSYVSRLTSSTSLRSIIVWDATLVILIVEKSFCLLVRIINSHCTERWGSWLCDSHSSLIIEKSWQLLLRSHDNRCERYMYTHIYTFMYTYIYIWIYIYIYIYIYTYICIYKYIYVYMYIYTYTYTYIYIIVEKSFYLLSYITDTRHLQRRKRDL